jgi:hypothetical protein
VTVKKKNINEKSEEIPEQERKSKTPDGSNIMLWTAPYLLYCHPVCTTLR